MWTSPTRPPSSWRNAPYGVIRCTVPSTTAPTSRSAMSGTNLSAVPRRLDRPTRPNPGRRKASVPPPRKRRQYAVSPVVTKRRARRPLASADAGAGLAVLRNHHEWDLPRLDHAEAFAGEPLEVGGVLELRDPVVQLPVLVHKG